MSHNSHRVAIVAFLVAAAVVAGACAGGASPNPELVAGATQDGSGANVMPATTTGNADGGSAIDVCALLPADQVSAIIKASLSGTVTRSNPNTHDYGCTYGQQAVLVDVTTPGGAADYAAQMAQYGDNDRPVAGFGDKAFQNLTDGTGLVALFGDTEFDVFITDRSGGDTEADINAESEAIITALKAKL